MIIALVVLVALVVAVVAQVDHRIPAAAGLVALLAMAVFLIVDRSDLANLSATLAFFLLAFSAALTFFAAIRRDKRRPDER